MTVTKKANRHKFLPYFFILFLVVFTGCTAGKVKPVSDAYVPLPEKILDNITRAHQQRDTLQAVATIEVNSEKGRYPLKVALLLKMPSFLRVETIPLVGTPDFFMSLQGDTLKVFLPPKKEFYICRATAENLALFLPVSIRVEEMVPILMGIPLLPELLKSMEKSRALSAGNYYRIDLTSGDGKHQSLWIDRTTGALAKIEIFEDYRLLYTASYEEYSEESGIPMPRKVIITPDAPGKSGVVIRYSDIRFSNLPDTTSFDLAAPPGIEPIVLF
ncbi:MAG: DUF4292 domain-containing protein [Deltaproteobacteria bacterium]|nr:DUF4292 domain-containing protein [Deltaproteobacteria bacterium]